MPYHSFRLELSLCRVNFFEENILQIHLLKENATEVKKRLLQVLWYLSLISLQTKTKLPEQPFKGVLNCCKLAALKCQTRPSYSFW